MIKMMMTTAMTATKGVKRERMIIERTFNKKRRSNRKRKDRENREKNRYLVRCTKRETPLGIVHACSFANSAKPPRSRSTCHNHVPSLG